MNKTLQLCILYQVKQKFWEVDQIYWITLKAKAAMSVAKLTSPNPNLFKIKVRFELVKKWFTIFKFICKISISK